MESIDARIAEARAAYSAEELAWAARLLGELEDRQLGLGLSWAMASLGELARVSADPNEAQLSHWLTELSRLSENRAEPQVLFEMSRHIWFHHRDEFHTALAHLYTACGHLAAGDLSHYRTSLVWAVDMLGQHPCCRSSGAAIPLELYGRYASQGG